MLKKQQQEGLIGLDYHSCTKGIHVLNNGAGYLGRVAGINWREYE